MKTKTFKDQESVEIFKSVAGVKEKATELQESGEVILAYEYDEPATEKAQACDVDERIYEAMSEMWSYTDRRIDYVHDRIDRVMKAFAEHNRGHLPAIKSASQMEAALESLGLGNEYEVRKGTIYLG